MEETVKQVSVDQLVDPATLPTRKVVHWVFTYVGNLQYGITVRPDLNEEMRHNSQTGTFSYIKSDDRRNVLSATDYEAANRLFVAMETSTEPVYPEGKDPRVLAQQQLATELLAAEKRFAAAEQERQKLILTPGA